MKHAEVSPEDAEEWVVNAEDGPINTEDSFRTEAKLTATSYARQREFVFIKLLTETTIIFSKNSQDI